VLEKSLAPELISSYVLPTNESNYCITICDVTGVLVDGEADRLRGPEDDHT
jgi:hypothetical protein